MIFDDVIRNDFKIEDGKFYEKTGYSWLGYSVQKFGWGGNEYKIVGDYSAADYSIDTDAYGDWYLRKGYSQVVRLYHHGGENWTSY